MSTTYSVGQMNQLGDALEAAGFTPDDVTKLRSFSGLAAIKNVVNGLAKIVVAALLRKVATAAVGPSASFIAAKNLQRSNVGWTNGNFDKFFRSMAEVNIGDALIVVHNLERDSLDAPIMAELGNLATINLAHFFELLERQSKGQAGVLLTNGRANIAYIIGSDGNVWAVHADWSLGSDFWRVDARSVEDPDRWSAGRQILSRDS